MRPYIIYYICCLHIVWFFLLLTDPAVINITAIHSMAKIKLLDDPIILGITIMACSILALWGMNKKLHTSFVGLLLLLPQQFLVMESAIGAIVAIVNSCFGDGLIRPRAFIAADQAPAIIAGVLHTVAIIEIHIGQVLRYWIHTKIISKLNNKKGNK